MLRATAFAVLLTFVGQTVATAAETSDPADVEAGARAAARQNALYKHSLYAYRHFHSRYGRSLRVSAVLTSCGLKALAGQIRPSGEDIKQDVWAYLTEANAVSEVDLFELLASVQATSIAYEYGYGEGIGLMSDDLRQSMCSTGTKMADDIVTQKTDKKTFQAKG